MKWIINKEVWVAYGYDVDRLVCAIRLVNMHGLPEWVRSSSLIDFTGARKVVVPPLDDWPDSMTIDMDQIRKDYRDQENRAEGEFKESFDRIADCVLNMTPQELSKAREEILKGAKRIETPLGELVFLGAIPDPPEDG